MSSGWGLAAWFSRSVDGTRALCPVILVRPVPTQCRRTVSGNQSAHRDPMGVEDLLAQAKLLDQLVILPVVLSLEVIEYLATLAHHLQQSAPRMMILDVRLEVRNAFQDNASSRFGCKVPPASTCPVPRNFASSAKTAMLPLAQSTDIVRPWRNFAARGASSVRRGQDWRKASRGRSRSRRSAREIAPST